MPYLDIDYSIISAQLVNAVIVGVVLFNTANQDIEPFKVSFDKISNLSVTYTLTTDLESRVHTLNISGPDAIDAELINESHESIDEIDRQVMACIGKAVNLTIVPAYLKMAETQLDVSGVGLSRTVQ